MVELLASGPRPFAGDRVGPPRVVWMNGRLESADKDLLTVTDRGFQVGDGVFETIRVVGGRVLELPLHISRLQASAAALEIPLPADLEQQLEQAIADTCRASELCGSGTQVAVRVTVSRGSVDGRALIPPQNVRPNLVLQAWRVEPPPVELLRRGLHLVISAVRHARSARWPRLRRQAGPSSSTRNSKHATSVPTTLYSSRQRGS